MVSTASESSVKGWEAAFPVGATLLFCGLVGKEISGSSMNSARSLGPALFGAEMGTIWIYLLAPLAGVLLGVITTYMLFGSASKKERDAAQGK